MLDNLEVITESLFERKEDNLQKIEEYEQILDELIQQKESCLYTIALIDKAIEYYCELIDSYKFRLLHMNELKKMENEMDILLNESLIESNIYQHTTTEMENIYKKQDYLVMKNMEIDGELSEIAKRNNKVKGK